MGSIRARDGKLFFDFRYRGVRCREQTTLQDTADNRKQMMVVLGKIEAAITLGTFVYADFFPNSLRSDAFAVDPSTKSRRDVLSAGQFGSTAIPEFEDFFEDWFSENKVQWKRSYQTAMKSLFNRHLILWFGDMRLDQIKRTDILKFRSEIAKPDHEGKTLSSTRINHIMTPLKMILAEAAERYDFSTPFVNIKALKVPYTVVDPFSIEEVKLFLEKIRPDFRNYYTVRFFSGLRTAEVDGLQWKYVDFKRREILIRETVVDGVVETPKTPGSIREVMMSQLVYNALKSQYTVTGKNEAFVFCNTKGKPLRHRDVTKRIWYPALRYMELKPRRPYQTRHTAATLWLAAGENPEWIARQMGHTTTKMLFTVYSRYVPNLTRQDGSAFEQLILSRMEGGNDE